MATRTEEKQNAPEGNADTVPDQKSQDRDTVAGFPNSKRQQPTATLRASPKRDTCTACLKAGKKFSNECPKCVEEFKTRMKSLGYTSLDNGIWNGQTAYVWASEPRGPEGGMNVASIKNGLIVVFSTTGEIVSIPEDKVETVLKSWESYGLVRVGDALFKVGTESASDKSVKIPDASSMEKDQVKEVKSQDVGKSENNS